jgi:phenylacetate-CoA ligase
VFQPEWESMDRKELRKLQSARLRERVEQVYHRVPFYRRRFEEAGITPEKIRGV